MPPFPLPFYPFVMVNVCDSYLDQKFFVPFTAHPWKISVANLKETEKKQKQTNKKTNL